MIEARLTDELKLVLYDTDKGKEIKSFPRKGTDPEKREAAEAKFKEMKQNINTIVSSQKDYLKKLFLSGEIIEEGQWEKDYLNNPVLMRIAQLLVWNQEKEFFTVKEGKPITCDGEPYSITKESVRLAHPIEMSDKQLSSWQKYFLSNKRKQLFNQVWEPIAFRKDEDLNPDRYNSCIITVGQILTLEKQGLVKYNYNADAVTTNFRLAESVTIPGELREYCHWFTERGPENTISLGRMDAIQITESRKLNRAIAYLDQRLFLIYEY